MNERSDMDRVLRHWFESGPSSMPDRVVDVVADRIGRERQRRAWRLPWRPLMNAYAKLAAGLAAVIIIAFVAWPLVPSGGNSGGTSTPVATMSPTSSASPTVSPSPSTPSIGPSQAGSFGGTVQWRDNGAPVTTQVDVVASGATATGTAVHTLGGGTHTVRLGCVARDGDTWALAGTVEKSTVPGEKAAAGFWSRVLVKDGSPQQISIWLSADAPAGIDCAGFLAAFPFADLAPENFAPVESGELVPPPGLAP